MILGENLRDAALVIKMAEVYGISAGLSGVTVRFRPDGGGGSTTAVSFRQYRDDPRLCVCVVDSDRRSAGEEVGDTASAVLCEVDDGKPWVIVLVSPCRTSENALSTSLLENALDGRSEMVAKVPNIEQLERVAPAVRNYCDFKKGTRLSDVFSVVAASSGEPWRSEMQALQGLPGVRSDCVTRGRCLGQPSCGCSILPGMGDNLLKLALEAMERTSLHKISEALCETTRPHWEDFGRTVFSWVCGRRPKPV